MKYIVQYTLPYAHQVMVGITAESREAAITKAETLFNQGVICDDTTEVLLLFDDFEELGDAGISLAFTVVEEVSGDWPDPDASVMEYRRRNAAMQAAHLLVDAYQRGKECGGSIDWDDLDQAYQAALDALATSPAKRAGTTSSSACKRLAIIVEGGRVQAVVADRPDAAPAIAVIDYDTDGVESDKLRHITQPDGYKVNALVVEHCIAAAIDLSEVFQDAES